jgi:phosphate transport system permease protein
MNIMLTLYTRRRIINAIGLAISMLAMAFGLFWLCWILWTLLEHGLPALAPVVFAQMTH